MTSGDGENVGGYYNSDGGVHLVMSGMSGEDREGVILSEGDGEVSMLPSFSSISAPDHSSPFDLPPYLLSIHSPLVLC